MNLQDIHYKRDISWKAVEALRTFDYFKSLAQYIDEKTFSVTRWRVHHSDIYIYPKVLDATFIREIIMPYVRNWDLEHRRFSEIECVTKFNEGECDYDHCITITLNKEEIRYLRNQGITGW